MSNQEMTKTNDQVVQTKDTASTDDSSNVTKHTVTLRPLVNIIEAEDGFKLTAEMPGVPKEAVEVNVDNDTLTLAGDITFPTVEGMKATYAEVKTSRYERAFTLSKELDSDKIEASQADGVLTLHIPKAEHAKPRKIEVQTG